MVLVNVQIRQTETTVRTKLNSIVFNNWGIPMAGDALPKNFQELEKWEREKQRHKREQCEG